MLLLMSLVVVGLISLSSGGFIGLVLLVGGVFDFLMVGLFFFSDGGFFRSVLLSSTFLVNFFLMDIGQPST